MQYHSWPATLAKVCVLAPLHCYVLLSLLQSKRYIFVAYVRSFLGVVRSGFFFRQWIGQSVTRVPINVSINKSTRVHSAYGGPPLAGLHHRTPRLWSSTSDAPATPRCRYRDRELSQKHP